MQAPPSPPAHLGGVLKNVLIPQVLSISNATQISMRKLPHFAHLRGVVKGVLVLRMLCGEEV